MTAKEVECYHQKRHLHRRRKIIIGISIFIIVLLLICLIIWAALRPKKPKFLLHDATIFLLNVTAPNVVSLTLQLTVLAQNPNTRIGVYYDNIDVYAAFHSQQITIYTVIPASYSPEKGYNVWSPFLYGNNIPIAPFNGVSISEDCAAGNIPLEIHLDGRVRWRVGLVTSGWFHLRVYCEADIPFGNSGGVNGTAVKYELEEKCRVNIW